MTTPFEPGSRVRITANHDWAQNALGTVRVPPTQILQLADGWHGHVRHVKGAKAVLYFQWVEFDEPHRDADGDGPYQTAEIRLDYLEAAV